MARDQLLIDRADNGDAAQLDGRVRGAECDAQIDRHVRTQLQIEKGLAQVVAANVLVPFEPHPKAVALKCDARLERVGVIPHAGSIQLTGRRRPESQLTCTILDVDPQRRLGVGGSRVRNSPPVLRDRRGRRRQEQGGGGAGHTCRAGAGPRHWRPP